MSLFKPFNGTHKKESMVDRKQQQEITDATPGSNGMQGRGGGGGGGGDWYQGFYTGV